MDNALNWDHRMEIRKGLDTGTLLLAEPFLPDPYFGRSVVLVCDHDAEEGSFGFIINQPLPRTLGEITEDIDVPDATVFFGGPVNEQTLHFLHRNDPPIDDALHLFGHWYWGGDLRQLTAALEDGRIAPADIRLFLGYSGWGQGQLRQEIIGNSWILAEMRDAYFDLPPEDIWSQALTDMGGIYRTMAHYPENPSSN